MIDLNTITTLLLCVAGSSFAIGCLVRWRRRIKNEERKQRNIDRAIEKAKATTYADVEWRGPRGNVK